MRSPARRPHRPPAARVSLISPDHSGVPVALPSSSRRPDGDTAWADAPPARTGVRGAIVAFAARRDTARVLLITADAAAASFSFGIGVQVLADSQLRPSASLAIPSIVVLARIFGLYERLGRGLGRSTLTDVPRQFQVATLSTLLASMLGEHLIRGTWQPVTTAVLWVCLLSSLTIARAAARWIPAALAPERCLVIGDLERAARVRRTIVSLSGGRSRVVGWVTLDQLVHCRDREALAELVALHRAEHLVIAPVVIDTAEVIELVRSVDELDLRVTLMPRLLELASATLTPDVIGGAAGLDIRRLGLSRSERWVKRALDVAGALLLGILLCPLLVAIAVAIKLTSRGPVLFRQQRVGRDGRQFPMLKFRTMVVDAEARKTELRPRNQAADGLFKLVDDPRVTPVGRLLRRTSLDELPQLWNILRGQMSMVGPRPLIAEEDNTIAGLHRRRLRVRPGMTGIWQVMGSARVPLSEMVELDHLYVLSWSPWLDLKILFRTLAFVLARKGM
jgi:exopolysaccharide biosynthesis polyprenyl glycosylphosphotransferase